MTECALALVLLAVPESVFDNPQPWERVSVKGALTLDHRPIAGTAYSEYRVTTLTDASVEALCLAIFEWGTKGTDVPGLARTRVLREGPDERLVYNQVEQPVVSNRDYAMTVRRTREAGVCRIRFRITNDGAPPTPSGFVRMENMWGGWTFEPSGEKTKVTYVLFADPGGSVPSFLVHGGQRSSALDSVALGMTKARVARAP